MRTTMLTPTHQHIDTVAAPSAAGAAVAFLSSLVLNKVQVPNAHLSVLVWLHPAPDEFDT
jgi:hypothetical protein